MFSNVSSFFQAKKKELLDAQREAEEQYQQRVHQHERKKKVMQERARATASTFAVSPKPLAAKANPGPGSESGYAPDSVAPQQQSEQPSLFSYVTPRSPTRSQAPRSPTSPKGAQSPLNLAGMVRGSPKPADATISGATSPDVAEPSEPVSIVAPVPITPIVISPRLSRGGEAMSSLIGDNGLLKDVDQESQQEIEKELLEALETEDIVVPTPPSRLSAVAAAQPGLTALLPPARSVTPGGESYSPFSEVSIPSSPTEGVMDDLLGAESSSQEDLKPKEKLAATVAAGGETELPANAGTAGATTAPLGEALSIP